MDPESQGLHFNVIWVAGNITDLMLQNTDPLTLVLNGMRLLKGFIASLDIQERIRFSIRRDLEI